MPQAPKRDSNLGPNHMSLLEVETWRIRPLGHHGQFFGNVVVSNGIDDGLTYKFRQFSQKLLIFFQHIPLLTTNNVVLCSQNMN